jgi:hypothetical protein
LLCLYLGFKKDSYNDYTRLAQSLAKRFCTNRKNIYFLKNYSIAKAKLPLEKNLGHVKKTKIFAFSQLSHLRLVNIIATETDDYQTA